MIAVLTIFSSVLFCMPETFYDQKGREVRRKRIRIKKW